MPADKKGKILKSAGFGLEVQKAVKARGSNPRRLSAEIEYAYDHVRKVYNGSEFPGKTLMKKICSHLGLDYNKMLALVEVDKAFDKDWVDLVLDEDPIITDVKRYWKHLSKRDKQEILELVKAKATNNIKH